MIEFNVGKDTETECVVLYIRGDEPKEVFASLINDLNTRLAECGTGELFTPGEPAERWKAYRD